MKVADGFWLSKKGYNVNYASQAYKVETTENSIKVLATPYTVMNRGMTLGGPNLEITYSSTSENIIKVHIDHYRGGLDNSPRYELNEDTGYTPVIERTEDKVTLQVIQELRLRLAMTGMFSSITKTDTLQAVHGEQHLSFQRVSSRLMHA